MACLFVVSAPSGAGKTSIINAVLAKHSDIVLPISYSTRPRRKNEEHNKQYNFVSNAVFQAKIDAGDFVEYASVFGHFYGTALDVVENNIKNNKDILLELDWQGALHIQKRYPFATLIYIMPPSIDVLEKRLIARNLDSAEVITTRIQQARDDIKKYIHYDYVVVNKDFTKACDDFACIIRSCQMALAHNSECLRITLESWK